MKAYLKAETGEGMFSSESLVTIGGYYDGEATLTHGFFEKMHIKDGRLEVEVLDEKEESVFVRLPGRTLEAPGDKGYMTVRKEDLKYELADNCYECVSFVNVRNAENGISEPPKVSNTIPKLFDIRDGKSAYGLCCRLGDCGGEPYVVRKEQTTCIFVNPDKKLSPEEIKQRDKNEIRKYESLLKAFEHARKVVESWPEWKREIKCF